MNISKYSKYLNVMYKDRLFVSRFIEVENNDKTVDMRAVEIESLKDIPCRLSKVKADEHNLNSIDANSGNIKFKVFCSTEVEILKGDTIVINKIIDGIIVDTIKGIAAKPLKYDLDQEFMIIESEVA